MNYINYNLLYFEYSNVQFILIILISTRKMNKHTV